MNNKFVSSKVLKIFPFLKKNYLIKMKIVLKLYFLLVIYLFFTNCQYLDYSGKGWPQQCQGSQQSPIDFPSDTSNFIALNSTRILFSSYNTLANVSLEVLPFAKFAAKNDHMGELYFEKNGLIYKYLLNEIHFHYRTEHTFGGEESDLEMHMVHTKDTDFFFQKNPLITEDPDSRNQKLVIAVIFDRNATSSNADGSKENSFISKLKFDSLETIDPIDLNEFARRDRLFLHYEGSLTTPSCNEIVNWIVMTEFEAISEEQLNNFYELINSNGYPNGNHRTVQPLNGRPIYYNDLSSLSNVEVTSSSANLKFWKGLLLAVLMTVFI